MAYKMYDPQGQEVTYNNLQEKGVWCVIGASKEEAFVQLYGEQLNLVINPEKEDDPYSPDLYDTQKSIRADLKTQNTPFFQAQTRFGISPQHAIVFNGKDRERYKSKYSEIDIYFIVDWQAVKFETNNNSIEVEPMTGVWRISFTKLDELCEAADYHTYQQRVGDTRGNARGSYVLDITNPAFEKVI